jgi:AcrR family transcriptional regulator
MSIERGNYREKNRMDSILAAAEDMMKSNGKTQLNISDLAKKLRISRGIIYYYFDNEENLIAKIIANKMERLLSKISKIPEQKSGFEELKSLCKCFYNFLKEHNDYLNLIPHIANGECAGSDDKALKYHVEYENRRNELFCLVMNAIERGIKDGSIQPIAESYKIAYIIWASIGSFWQHMMRDNTLQSVQESRISDVDKLIDIYFDMIFRALEK